jgi:hypothetical protein
MTSLAIREWDGPRKARMKELHDVHTQVGGAGSGRRWKTQQINWALALRTAGEFQGFCRDLHDEAAEYFATQSGGLNAQLVGIVRTRLTVGRRLDLGNATPGNLGDDFSRFGMNLWPSLNLRHPAAPDWNKALEALNDCRNGIAHSDEAKIDRLRRAGWPLSQLATIKRFQATTDKVARAMDTEVSDHLARLFGGGAPW